MPFPTYIPTELPARSETCRHRGSGGGNLPWLSDHNNNNKNIGGGGGGDRPADRARSKELVDVRAPLGRHVEQRRNHGGQVPLGEGLPAAPIDRCRQRRLGQTDRGPAAAASGTCTASQCKLALGHQGGSAAAPGFVGNLNTAALTTCQHLGHLHAPLKRTFRRNVRSRTAPSRAAPRSGNGSPAEALAAEAPVDSTMLSYRLPRTDRPPTPSGG